MPDTNKPVPIHYPERGLTLDNGATVLDVNEEAGILLALSPTGAFAIWDFVVTDSKTTTLRGRYFNDIYNAALAFKDASSPVH